MSDEVFIEADLMERPFRMRRFTFCAFFVIVLFGLVAWVLIAKHYRERCGAHQVIAMSEVRAISMLAHYYLDEGEQLPPTILAYFDDPQWDTSQGLRVTQKPCGLFDAEEIRIGRYSMADVLARRVRQSKVIQEAINTLGDTDTWESYRTMGFLRDERAWTHGGDLIVFWMLYQHDGGGDAIHLCFAGDRVAYVLLRDLKEHLDTSDALAARLGIDPAPAELRSWCRD